MSGFNGLSALECTPHHSALRRAIHLGVPTEQGGQVCPPGNVLEDLDLLVDGR